MNALEIAAIGLQQDTERLKAISHNVANLATPGFKRQVAVQTSFVDAMDAARQSQSGLSLHTDTRAGKLRVTGNSLDLALAEGEYLLVQLADRSFALTRDASLTVDAAGRLSTFSGLPVQGTSGDLVVPRAARDVRIDAAGNLLADDSAIGALNVVRAKAGEPLRALGGGLFAMVSGAAVESVRPTGMRPGHVEASNVVASQEMVNLMTTTRHAESMVRLIQGADDLLEKAIRKFGEI